jgi:hypothetical protein
MGSVKKRLTNPEKTIVFSAIYSFGGSRGIYAPELESGAKGL